MTYNHSSVTIEAHLDSVTIDNGEPIAIPDTVKNVSQFAGWFTENQIGNPTHLSQSITILRSYLRSSYTNPRSFSELRSRK